MKVVVMKVVVAKLVVVQFVILLFNSHLLLYVSLKQYSSFTCLCNHSFIQWVGIMTLIEFGNKLFMKHLTKTMINKS